MIVNATRTGKVEGSLREDEGKAEGSEGRMVSLDGIPTLLPLWVLVMYVSCLCFCTFRFSA